MILEVVDRWLRERGFILEGSVPLSALVVERRFGVDRSCFSEPVSYYINYRYVMRIGGRHFPYVGCYPCGVIWWLSGRVNVGDVRFFSFGDPDFFARFEELLSDD